MGSLPGKPEPNPKEFVNAIMLRSGKQLLTNELNRDIEPKGGEVVVEIDDEDELILKDLGKDKEAEGVVVDKGKSKVVEEPKQDKTIDEITKKSKGVAKETLFVPPPYEPRLPFPGRFKKQQVDKYRAMFDAQMKDVAITTPIIDAFLLNPSYSKFLKDAVLEKKKALQGMVILTHECSAIIQNKVVAKKLEDPGSFTLPCTLGPLSFGHCLCDLGSSVSLMPLSVAKRLGFTHYKKCMITLVLADRSIRTPVGVLEDLPVMIGHFEIPTDFVVLEMDEEPKDPLILGRPFLRTAGTMIDVKGGKIQLNLGKEALTFDINQVMRKPTIGGQVFYIEKMEALADELLEELAIEDELQSTLTVKQGEFGLLKEDSEGYQKILDSHKPSKDGESFLELKKQVVCSVEVNSNEDWSELKAPKIELKPLPKGLRYAFLGKNSTYPVIINEELSEHETVTLLGELKKFRRAIGYSLDDIKGISETLCMHRIHLDDESMTSIEPQRRLNPNLRDVVRKEILKLLDAGIIYPISDSTWVSPVHVVPKNDKDELIPTRTITGHRMCIDYRRLNDASRKDHFSLPFIDQMLERLASHTHYCFLDGYSGFFQIPIHPNDQETTFTCPYGHTP
ncbi:PREDICTED: uncharacterized protein LOC104759899 [Camelina sativa]|uniref:Uncharacterized protein LOC104759899 n=1 Tax=Camelina sativa TaxID=90675 RepID=A0ABM0X5L3_CAMSA|nr:PREDICTED: uncharacterized protein LOC104759899 [Camelina sativa]